MVVLGNLNIFTATAYSTPCSDSGMCAGREEEEEREAAVWIRRPWSEPDGHYAAIEDAFAAVADDNDAREHNISNEKGDKEDTVLAKWNNKPTGLQHNLCATNWGPLQ